MSLNFENKIYFSGFKGKVKLFKTLEDSENIIMYLRLCLFYIFVDQKTPVIIFHLERHSRNKKFLKYYNYFIQLINIFLNSR